MQLSKIFERIINSRLVKYSNENDFIYGKQFEFKRNYSNKQDCIIVIQFVNEMTETQDGSLATVGVFCDLCRAIDRVVIKTDGL